MIGTILGLTFGAGLACIWWSFWPRQHTERRTSKWKLRLTDLLTQAGMVTVGPTALIVTSVCFAVIVGFALTITLGGGTIPVAFAILALFVPQTYVRFRARRRRVQLRTLWPDAVDDISSAIRAGMSLPEALESLAERGPEALRPQFVEFARDYRATGRFSDSLDRLKDRLADPVADRIIESLRLTREVGGSDLGRLLRTLARFLREDLRARGELEARQSWTVNGARLAALAPWAILAMLSTRAETVDAFNSTAGVLVLACGAIATLGAYAAMIRLSRLPEDKRVMR